MCRDRPEGLRRPLTCVVVVDAVTDYIEGFLTHDDEVRMGTHLLACRGCRAYLDQMRATIAALRQLRSGIPDQLRDELRTPFGEVPRSAPDY